MSRFIMLLVCISAVFELTGCAGSVARPDAMAREQGDRLSAIMPGAGGRTCHDIKALIPVGGAVEGPNCPANQAVINGWSVKCVQEGGCNTPARRNELNQAAEAFCAGWCADKGCGYTYGPRAECDSSWCLNSDFCVQNCDAPLRDACYFQQSAPAYNCQCMVQVES